MWEGTKGRCLGWAAGNIESSGAGGQGGIGGRAGAASGQYAAGRRAIHAPGLEARRELRKGRAIFGKAWHRVRVRIRVRIRDWDRVRYKIWKGGGRIGVRGSWFMPCLLLNPGGGGSTTRRGGTPISPPLDGRSTILAVWKRTLTSSACKGLCVENGLTFVLQIV